jgi:hypothetical protein
VTRAIELLQDISRRCLAEEPLSDEQLRWLGESLSDFLSHRCRTLDEAMGLSLAFRQEPAVDARALCGY